MTDKLICFDTDCLSSFLWVGNENLIVNLYKNHIILPKPTYDEICYVPHLKRKVDIMLSNGDLNLQMLSLGSPEFVLFNKLTAFPDVGFNTIGKGEASAIVLAKFNNGILGSNNLVDTRRFINQFHLNFITTAGILVKAYNSGLISEAKGNGIWLSMTNRQRKLPAVTFTDFLKSGLAKEQYIT